MRVAIGVVLAAFVASCGPSRKDRLRADETALAMNAFRSLEKIQAATEAGVNYQKYGELLIEARALVNETQLLLSDQDLKKKFESVIDAYMAASKVWSEKVKDFNEIYCVEEPYITMVTKYSLPVHKDKYGTYFEANSAIQIIWAQASIELLLAGAQVQQKLKSNK
jgi:hypothetical protein